MTKEKLTETLAAHNLWVESNTEKGERADLSGADLSGADLSGADLGGADLRGANLRGADLSGADLVGANLRGAFLRDSDLRGANLRDSDLRGADLDFACWILSCRTLTAKIDARIAAQLLYHTVRAAQSVESPEWRSFCAHPMVAKLANTFHRVEECGVIKAGDEPGKEDAAGQAGLETPDELVLSAARLRLKGFMDAAAFSRAVREILEH